jgi:hypothetical protein
MKKMVLGLSLALAALGFLMSPAMAANPPQVAPALSAADRAFIASLAATAKNPAAPALAAKRPLPGPGAKALCTATANCESGTVTCSGNNSTTSCTAVDRNCSWGEQGHVTCDGATTWCPTACPGCPPSWCTREANCSASCYPCDYDYTCDATYCTDDCRCRWSTCPI